MNYPIEIIRKKAGKDYVNKFLGKPFDEVVKFVVDIERKIIALGGELHSDAGELLIEDGSDNRNLWGGNIYPLRKKEDELVEYNSLINIKPLKSNFSLEVQDDKIKQEIRKIINELMYG
ncbi:MAG: hypothetical protein A2626_00830 [Candidatus Nealsonbacteria bacterium RIFCSPHIGHO2_01_FULL_38_55]|uniref:Uncharacterized protein n=1 Tax=Candidatus Nealsonbacteria bacterium RIFCSPHIGHO2_01_FULL_38_55 TaxID=1801664 RepID=A0A1G2E2D1_9BACT|nr:MAG: hypothetical protein UT22_C0002G0032 [Parcubacteria group bacterium GW2011_GWC2_39_11]OGZ19963.1 MAG: hypothetical protein A2626_00830 [Candidatus Nealsonbacteria bacterium RIFCSPHIGHO2_01_FULL_38_55]OGZ20547.1 MAG: hypothetical protein A2W55_01960 [Candidatus Nealsonbacteria bacterium RIFCSPHIGHO2_02_38_10]OGZ23383.1 MAG: hypothetical protein A3E18_03000 [Candidatus Nealsonbacteria bacterium RIFCSPHIGHO2_12_FULL_38_18]OGZ26461.1 MAG: hypothetical protein A3I85_00995 [Candidatus Nealson